MLRQLELGHFRNKLYQPPRPLGQFSCFGQHRAHKPEYGEILCLPSYLDKIECSLAIRKGTHGKHSERCTLQNTQPALSDFCWLGAKNTALCSEKQKPQLALV